MMVQLPVVSAQTEKGIVFYLVDKHQRQKKYDLPLYKDYNVAWLKDEVRGLFRTEQVMFDLSDKTRTYESTRAFFIFSAPTGVAELVQSEAEAA